MVSSQVTLLRHQLALEATTMRVASLNPISHHLLVVVSRDCAHRKANKVMHLFAVTLMSLIAMRKTLPKSLAPVQALTVRRIHPLKQRCALTVSNYSEVV